LGHIDPGQYRIKGYLPARDHGMEELPRRNREGV
jgi:hypothetical protein